ncbi:MAG: hypothetical protein LBL31_08080 [Spirochaetaceae bacterium]|jgi:hypothetical protein|nr:hypothetical protein [Spirochaetaceae bacterium]
MKKTIAFILMLCCAVAVFAEETRAEMPRFEIPTARSNGFGGSHIAYTDDVFALLVNPAAIMRVRQRSFFTLSPSLASPQKTIELAGKIAGGDMGASLEGLNNPNNPGKIPFGFGLGELPLSIAYVANGFGFGIWDRVHVDLDLVGTTAEAVVLADVIIPIGFAFKILDTDAHDVDAGVTVKIFGRGYGEQLVTVAEVVGDLAKISEDLGMPVIMGAGFDLGFLYRWDIGLSAGVTFDDIFTHGSEIARIGNGEAQDGYYVPFSLNLGVAYDFKIGNVWKTAPGFIARSGITAAFDWHDFDLLFETKNPYFKRNPALGIGMGLQFNLADIFKLRIGMNEMLPSFGFGFDLGAIEIDIAYYGRELGLEPGQIPVAMLNLTFAVRPGAKEKSWPWARTSLVEVISKQVQKSKAEDSPSEEDVSTAE